MRSVHLGSLFYQVTRLLLYAVLLLPIGVFLLHAFSERWFYPAVLPADWTFAPFLRQWNNPRTQEAIWTSTQVALLTSLLSLLVGYPAARVLGLRRFRGKALVYLILFLPTVIPPIATGIGLNILFLRLGLSGSVLGVTLVHVIPVLPYVVFTLAGVFARYDIQYEQQARVLGAGHWRIFWNITLPLVFPGLVVAVLFAFLISWSEYLLTLLIGGGRVITLPILLFSLISGGNPASISALALLFVALPVLAIITVSRYLGLEERLRLANR